MSCVLRIKESLAEFTRSERKIGEYILQNTDEIIGLSVQDLAQRIGVSAASVVRFSKTIGYLGYSSMKIEIARKLDGENYNHSMIIEKGDKPKHILDRLCSLNVNILEKGKDLIEKESLYQAIEIIGSAKKIYLYGVGASGIVAYDLFTKFSRVNIECFYQADTHMQAISAAYINSDDVVIAISYSGMTKEIKVPVEVAKESGAKIISITSNKKSKIGKLSDISFLIPREEKAKRVGAITSRNSQLFITDLLYLGVVSSYVDDINGSINKTKDIINRLS